MASEIQWRGTETGVTLYATIRSKTGTQWNTSGTPAFEAVTAANWTSYDIALAESTGNYFYVGTFPAISGNMVAGWYWVDIFKQAGASPAITDTLQGTIVGYWDGTTFGPWDAKLANDLHGGPNATLQFASSALGATTMINASGVGLTITGTGDVGCKVTNSGIVDAAALSIVSTASDGVGVEINGTLGALAMSSVSGYGVFISGGTTAIQVISSGANGDAVLLTPNGSGLALNVNGPVDIVGAIDASNAANDINVDIVSVGGVPVTLATEFNANVTKISGDATAADNLGLQFDGTGITGATFPARQSDIAAVGINQQDVRDAMLLAPTVGATVESGSIDDLLSSLSGCVVLSTSSVLINSIDTDGDITIHRGDSFSVAITNLGTLTARSKMWFTVKERVSDADSESILQITLDGLTYLNGDAVSPASATGAITIDDAATGDITISLDESKTKELSAASSLIYDIQMLTTGGVVSTLQQGKVTVNEDVTRAVS